MARSTTPQPEFGIAASSAQSTWRRIKWFPLHQAVGPNGPQQEWTNLDVQTDDGLRIEMKVGVWLKT